VPDEWDPWRRYIRHQERLFWDDWYRYQYEQERMQWDPFFRHEKEQERLQWDPYFRHLKELERRAWDPAYQRTEDPWGTGSYYDERSWWDEYMERKQRELFEEGLARRGIEFTQLPVLGGLAREEPATPTTGGGGGGYYVPYVSSDDELPSLASVLAESLIPVGVVAYFWLATQFGFGFASPLALSILFLLATLVLFGLTMPRAGLLLSIYALVLMLTQPWTWGDESAVRATNANALLESLLIMSAIAAVYIFYYYRKVKEEEW